MDLPRTTSEIESLHGCADCWKSVSGFYYPFAHCDARIFHVVNCAPLVAGQMLVGTFGKKYIGLHYQRYTLSNATEIISLVPFRANVCVTDDIRTRSRIDEFLRFIRLYRRVCTFLNYLLSCMWLSHWEDVPTIHPSTNSSQLFVRVTPLNLIRKMLHKLLRRFFQKKISSYIVIPVLLTAQVDYFPSFPQSFHSVFKISSVAIKPQQGSVKFPYSSGLCHDECREITSRDNRWFNAVVKQSVAGFCWQTA